MADDTPDPRSQWSVYSTVPMTPGSIEYRMCESRKIEPVTRLRRCPTCGARETLENGRLGLEPCDTEKHSTPTADAPLPVRRVRDMEDEGSIERHSGPRALGDAFRLLRGEQR